MTRTIVFFLAAAVILNFTGCWSKPVQTISVSDPSLVTNLPEMKFAADDWPWWHGPTLNGVAHKGQTPPIEWSETENIVWKTKVPGRSHATPIVVGQQIFVATADEEKQTQSLVCLNRATGKPEWTTLVHEGGFMGKHQENTHASATPACDGERVFVVFPNNGAVHVSALDRAGKILWTTEAGPFDPQHGYGASPVIYKSLVIVSVDSNLPGCITAIHRQSGEIVWRTPREQRASYGTPLVAKVAGKDQLFVSGQSQVTSYDPNTGKLLWKCKGPSEVTGNSMAWHGDRVFASGGYPEGVTICVRADGEGEVTESKRLWESKKAEGYVPTPMVLDDKRLLVVRGKGSVYSIVDIETGEETKPKRLPSDLFRASPIRCGEYVYLHDRKGKTFVFKNNAEFEQVAVNELPGDGYASPVIVGGQIFLKIGETVYCLGKAGS